MKRYEKMSKEDIIALYTMHGATLPSFKELYNDDTIHDFLYKEIEMIPRWATINSNDDIDKLWDEFVHTTYEVEFTEWLKELVKV